MSNTKKAAGVWHGRRHIMPHVYLAHLHTTMNPHPRLSGLLLVIAIVLTMGFAPPANAQDEPDNAPETQITLETVAVSGDRAFNFFANYRIIYAGLRAVEQEKMAMAPHAQIVFGIDPAVARTPAEKSTSTSTETTPASAPTLTLERKIKVSLVTDEQDLEVTNNGKRPFEFPLIEELALRSAQVSIAGAGPNPRLTVNVASPRSAKPEKIQVRLGDARLLCAFLTAARKEASTGLGWLTMRVLGTFTCKIPFPGNPTTHELIAMDAERKESKIKPNRERYFFPTHLSRYSNDTLLELRPISAPPTRSTAPKVSPAASTEPALIAP